MDTPYSIFTTCLLEALEGKATFEEDGFVRVEDVSKYLMSQVPERTSNRQHPSIRSASSENFALCYYEGGKNVAIEINVSQPPASPRLSPQQRNELVNLLLACSSIRDRNIREVILRNLPKKITSAIPRDTSDKVDVASIVNVCLNYPEGLQELVSNIELFESDSLSMQKLNVWWEEVNRENK